MNQPTHQQHYALRSRNNKELEELYAYLWHLPMRRSGRVSVILSGREGEAPSGILASVPRAYPLERDPSGHNAHEAARRVLTRKVGLVERLRGARGLESHVDVRGSEQDILDAEAHLARHLPGRAFLLSAQVPVGGVVRPERMPPPPGLDAEPEPEAAPVAPVSIDF